VFLREAGEHMAAKMITVWYKYKTKCNEAKLNHIEDGWVNGEYPKPIYPSYTNQEAWEKVIGRGNMLI